MTGSLAGRVLAAATAALLIFLGLTGLILDRAFQKRTELFYRSQLQSQVYSLLAAADLDAQGKLQLAADLPEPRFNRPNSGLYAEIKDDAGNTVWRSASAVGRPLPKANSPAVGVSAFSRQRWRDAEQLFLFQYGVAWEDEQGMKPYIVRAAESLSAYRAEVDAYRATIFIWLGGAGVLLLLLQTVLLRWTLAPLREVVNEVSAIERGEQSQLDKHYPRELRILTGNLNAFLANERRQRERYRDALADLAHSLKTPLTVIQTLIEKKTGLPTDKQEIGHNVGRMREIIDYQLQRAVAAGRATLVAAPVAVHRQIDKIVGALRKVYADKNLQCSVDVANDAVFFGEAGDLTEIMGNVLDNAFKWATSKVQISARGLEEQDGQRPGLCIMVDDDGPGVPDDLREAVLQRGVRHDSRTEGQGIGLAVAQEIAASYGGDIVIADSSLGGARVTLNFPGV